MRKFLLLAAIAMCAVTTQAQVISSTSSLTQKEVRPLAQYAKMSFDIGCCSEDDMSIRSGVGFIYGATKFLGNRGWYYGAESGFTPGGFTQTTTKTTNGSIKVSEEVYSVDLYGNITSSTVTSTKSTKTVTESNLKQRCYSFYLAPVRLGYMIDLNNNNKLDLSFGYYIAFNLKSDYLMDISSKDYVDNVLDSTSSYEGSVESESMKTGLNFGVGMWINNRFNVGIEFQKGLANSVSEDASFNYLRLAVGMRLNKDTKQYKYK